MGPAKTRPLRWLSGVAALLGVMATASDAPAQPRKPNTGLLAPTGTKPGDVAEPPPRKWHDGCANERRRPMALVLVYDNHRDYRPGQLGEAPRTRQVLSVLCPGDTVALYAVDTKRAPLGEPATIKELSDLDDLLLRVEKRRTPWAYTRINDHVTKAAQEQWGREENFNKKKLLRVLLFFTRDLESKAPRNAYVEDFSWASPPYWLHGEALVALFKPIATNTEVKAWETFVIAVPEFVDPEDMGQGLRVELPAWFEPALFEPEPKPAAKPKSAAARKLAEALELAPEVELPELPELWPTGDDVLLWDERWTPWVVSGGLGLALLLVLVWSFARSAPRRQSVLGVAEARDVTLIVHDRIHDSVVAQERARLDTSLRVGASSTSDVVVPGPYALEILPGPSGSAPRVRSTNSLTVEVQRAGGGRTLRASDSVPVPLRNGDRIHLGGGHDLEIRYTGS